MKSEKKERKVNFDEKTKKSSLSNKSLCQSSNDESSKENTGKAEHKKFKDYTKFKSIKFRSNHPTLPKIDYLKPKKIEYFGPITKGIIKEEFYSMNPPEEFPIPISDIYKGKYNHNVINIIDNGPRFIPSTNPYIKAVNQAMYSNDSNNFGFKAKCLYEKAYELSLLPKIAKMNEHNPIYFLSANPRDYKHYND